LASRQDKAIFLFRGASAKKEGARGGKKRIRNRERGTVFWAPRPRRRKFIRGKKRWKSIGKKQENQKKGVCEVPPEEFGEESESCTGAEGTASEVIGGEREKEPHKGMAVEPKGVACSAGARVWTASSSEGNRYFWLWKRTLGANGHVKKF